ncbi:hypothetical protein C5167_012128, partial [Papaver somniferum]
KVQLSTGFGFGGGAGDGFNVGPVIIGVPFFLVDKFQSRHRESRKSTQSYPIPVDDKYQAFEREFRKARESQKTTVTMLQVGLLGSARSLQKDLDKIAQVADASTRSGLSYILQESALAVLRHPDYCISGYAYLKWSWQFGVAIIVHHSVFTCTLKGWFG